MIENSFEYREQISYKPFGEVKERLYCTGSTDADARLKYIGKQLDFETNLADHGVRKYDNSLGMFTSIDPLWEKYYGWTPYHYCRNNPMNRLDYDEKEDPSFMEIAWSIVNPVAASKIFLNSMVSSALAASTDLPGESCGEQDAVRHALWSSMNARDVGIDKSSEIQNLHEEYSGNPQSDINMDLINNETGYSIGLANKKATDSQLLSIVLEYLEKGLLQTSATDTTLQKKEINKDEYPHGKKGAEDAKDSDIQLQWLIH